MQPWHEARWRRGLAPVGGGLLFVIVAILLSTRGLADGVPPLAGFAAFVFAAVFGLLLAGAYALAGFGLGRLPAALLARTAPARDRALWLQAPLGLGLLLTLSHLLGALGLLSGTSITARAAAFGPIALGLLLALQQLLHGRLRPERWPVFPPSAILWVPPAAILLVAACNPPGHLWASEHGAYDATSYHLQLPKEWISDPLDGGVGRIAPVPHNVYSYLPGYMEAAYTHLGQLVLHPRAAHSPVERLLGGAPPTPTAVDPDHDAFWVLACQILHALFALSAALTVARTAWVLLIDNGLSTPTPSGRAAALLSASSAGSAVFATPWLAVTGSLAYNDAAMLAAGAGALLCAAEPALPPVRRMAAAAFLVGIAASAKPTALIMFTPAVALLALRGVHLRAAVVALGAGALCGLATLAPWLIRNALAGGNPVFPFFPELFGPAHWRPDQFARYHAAHAFSGPWLDRFTLLFSERGLRHPQWAFWLPLLLASIALPLAARSARSAARPLLLGLGAMLLGWLATTHLQPRFLLPLLAPGGVLLGIGMALLLQPAEPRPRPLVPLFTAAVVAAPLLMSLWLYSGFLAQRGGRPNELLARGVGGLTGAAFAAQLEQMPDDQRDQFLDRAATPAHYINLLITPRLLTLGDAPATTSAQRVLLLGDAAALYFLAALGGHTAPVHAHTTWDASPLGEAIRAHPDDPARWTTALRERGFRWVLANFDELHRLIVIDGNYDPAVTVQALHLWLGGPAAPAPVRAWPPDLPLAPTPPPAGAVLYDLGPRAAYAPAADAPAIGETPP